ncbi:hypothetical protein CL616_00470 [archaeon]|nr:hypothetical protein [archaeon]
MDKDTNKIHRKLSEQRKENPSVKKVRKTCTKKNKPDNIARKLSFYFTPLVLNTNITPNEITLFWGIISFFIPLLFIFNNYYMNIIAAFLIAFIFFMDSFDGNVARYKKIFSPKAELLDNIPFWFLIIVSGTLLSWNSYINHNHIIYLILGMSFVINYSLSELLVYNGMVMKALKKEKGTKTADPTSHKKYMFLKKLLLWNPNYMVYGLIIALLINIPEIFLWFFSFSFFIHWLTKYLYDIKSYFI